METIPQGLESTGIGNTIRIEQKNILTLLVFFFSHIIQVQVKITTQGPIYWLCALTGFTPFSGCETASCIEYM